MTLSIFIVLADPIAVLRLSLSFSYRHHQVVGEKVSSNEDVQEEGVQDVKWYWTKHTIIQATSNAVRNVMLRDLVRSLEIDGSICQSRVLL